MNRSAAHLKTELLKLRTVRATATTVANDAGAMLRNLRICSEGRSFWFQGTSSAEWSAQFENAGSTGVGGAGHNRYHVGLALRQRRGNPPGQSKRVYGLGVCFDRQVTLSAHYLPVPSIGSISMVAKSGRWRLRLDP